MGPVFYLLLFFYEKCRSSNTGIFFWIIIYNNTLSIPDDIIQFYPLTLFTIITLCKLYIFNIYSITFDKEPYTSLHQM